MKPASQSTTMSGEERALLDELLDAGGLDETIPAIARDLRMMRRIETVVRNRITSHELMHGDARAASALDENSVHLVVRSPPYWRVNRYNHQESQMGHVRGHGAAMAGLDVGRQRCVRAIR